MLGQWWASYLLVPGVTIQPGLAMVCQGWLAHEDPLPDDPTVPLPRLLGEEGGPAQEVGLQDVQEDAS